jgi:hypothetical protein
MARLYGTNRLLIDSLEALDVKIDTTENACPDELALEPSMMSRSPIAALNRSVSVGDISIEEAAVSPPQRKITLRPMNNLKGDSNNARLREVLLKTAREHLKAVKKGEILEKELEEVRKRLKKSEQAGRILQLELDEIKSKDDGAALTKSIEQRLGGASTQKMRTKTLNKFDERLKVPGYLFIIIY